MKAKKTKLSVLVVPELKQRLEEAAHREGTTSSAWVVKAIEASLGRRGAKFESRMDDESHEFLHEEKLNDIRALREIW